MLSSLKNVWLGAGLAAVFAAGACVEVPTGPTTGAVTEAPREPATLEASAWSAQTASPRTAVSIAPAVLVKDAKGAAMTGVAVNFVVSAGGGSIEYATGFTDARGIATGGRWTLGSAAGLNEVTATAGTLPAVRFTATAVAPAQPVNPGPTTPSGTTGAYDIAIRYLSSVTAAQQNAVAQAVSRWRSVITTDLVNIPVQAAAGVCLPSQPALNEIVDDILIFVEFVAIDGPGKVLGEAGPCFVRSDNGLPIVGHLKLDAADLQQMEGYGTLNDVVLHEMGHILGIGTLWSNKTLVTGEGSDDPQFNGARAISAYRALGGQVAGVPVENSGGEGTRDGHWRESVFGNELMTGYVGGAPNPLSAMTIASLQDLGYGANAGAASTYKLGGTSGLVTAPVIDLHEHEIMVLPKYKYDSTGHRVPIR